MESAVWTLILRTVPPVHPSFSSGPATRASLEKAGFVDVEVRVLEDPWNWDSILNYVFETRIRLWNFTKELKDRMEGIRMAFERVVKEEYEGRKAIMEHAILALRRKA